MIVERGKRQMMDLRPRGGDLAKPWRRRIPPDFRNLEGVGDVER
jgi:hypothetical protein